MEFTRVDCLKIVAQLAALCFSLKYLMDLMEPSSKARKEAEKRAREVMSKLGLSRSIKLNNYETLIASHLVAPDELDAKWTNIGGLESTIHYLTESLIKPFSSKNNKNNLIKPPKGVLLHGPPGCGKTLLAQAVARESGCNFINLDMACIMDKWYGESQKIASAVFTLAQKAQPCIIFIDEIDCFLRTRDSQDHEQTAMVKALFLQHWDGLQSGNHNVCLLAATNRPWDIDPAVRRRLSLKIKVPTPSLEARSSILSLMLEGQVLSEDIDMEELALETECFSGADLKELCRQAAVAGLKSDGSSQIEMANLILAADFIKNSKADCV